MPAWMNAWTPPTLSFSLLRLICPGIVYSIYSWRVLQFWAAMRLVPLVQHIAPKLCVSRMSQTKRCQPQIQVGFLTPNFDTSKSSEVLSTCWSASFQLHPALQGVVGLEPGRLTPWANKILRIQADLAVGSPGEAKQHDIGPQSCQAKLRRFWAVNETFLASEFASVVSLTALDTSLVA